MGIVLSANFQRAEEAASASCVLSEQADNVKKILDSLVALVYGADAVHSYVRSQTVLQGTGSRYVAPQNLNSFLSQAQHVEK